MNTLAIGTYVRCTDWDYRGRVYQVHEGCPEGAAWRMGQSKPLDGVYAEGEGTWYSVLVHPAGSAAVPANRVEVIEPFDFQNPYAEETFGNHPRDWMVSGHCPMPVEAVTEQEAIEKALGKPGWSWRAEMGSEVRLPISENTAEPIVDFLRIWGDPVLCFHLAERLSCGEVEALADLFATHGYHQQALDWRREHGKHDDEGDAHHPDGSIRAVDLGDLPVN